MCPICAGGRRGVCGCGDSRICFETRSSRTEFHHVESVCEVEGVIGCLRQGAFEDAAKRMNPQRHTRFSLDKKDLREAGCNSDGSVYTEMRSGPLAMVRYSFLELHLSAGARLQNHG
jgi:hypothetical protein